MDVEIGGKCSKVLKTKKLRQVIRKWQTLRDDELIKFDKKLEGYNQKTVFDLFQDLGDNWNEYPKFMHIKKKPKLISSFFYNTLNDFANWYQLLKFKGLKIDGLDSFTLNSKLEMSKSGKPKSQSFSESELQK
jgi:hypothetical protein